MADPFDILRYRPQRRDWMMNHMPPRPMSWEAEATPEEIYRSQMARGIHGSVSEPDIDPVDLLAAPGLQALGSKAAKTYMTRSALPLSNKWQYAREIPQFGEALQEAGNLFSNSWKRIKGKAQEMVPQPGEWAPAMASAQQGPASVLFNEAIPQNLMGHWNVSIPYFASRERYPLAMIGEMKDINPIYKKLTGNFRDLGEDWRGFHTLIDPNARFYADLIGATPGSIEGGTIGHELGHMTASRVRGMPRVLDETRPWKDIEQDRRILGAALSPKEAQTGSYRVADWMDRRLTSLVPNPKKGFATEMTDQEFDNLINAVSLSAQPAYSGLAAHDLGEEMFVRGLNSQPYGSLLEEPFTHAFRSAVARHYHSAFDRTMPTGSLPANLTDFLAKWFEKHPDATQHYAPLLEQYQGQW